MELLFDAAMEVDEALVFDNTNRNHGLQLAARVKGKKLIAYDARFPWIRTHLISKFNM